MPRFLGPALELFLALEQYQAWELSRVLEKLLALVLEDLRLAVLVGAVVLAAYEPQVVGSLERVEALLLQELK